MQPAMLQLKHYHFNAFSLHSRAGVVEFPHLEAGEAYPSLQAEELRPQVSHAEPDAEDPRVFVIKLALEHSPVEGSTFPYDFKIEAEGVFNTSHEGDLEERRRLVVINGASILYSAMREHLLTLSARHRYGPVLLPCLDFRGMARREVSKDGGDEGP